MDLPISISTGSSLYQPIKTKHFPQTRPHSPWPLALLLLFQPKPKFVKERPILTVTSSPELYRKYVANKVIREILLSRACGLLFLTYTQKPTLHLVSMTASPPDSHPTSLDPPFQSHFQTFVPQNVVLSPLLYNTS